MSATSQLQRRPSAPSAVAIVRRRAAPPAVPLQEPADERCDYIPVPPIGYDDEGYPVEDTVPQSQRHVAHIVDWHGALRDWCRRHDLGEVFSDLLMPYRRAAGCCAGSAWPAASSPRTPCTPARRPPG